MKPSWMRRPALVVTPTVSTNGKPAWEAIDFNGNGKIDDEPVEADINGDGKKTVLTAPNDLKTLKLQAKGKEVQNGGTRPRRNSRRD